MVAIESAPKVFATSFKDLHVWSVGSYYRINWQWRSDHIKPLSSALERRHIEIDKSQFVEKGFPLITLHFDGSIEPRKMENDAKFKGKLYFAFPSDVVYSKIDVRNGAIGVILDNMPPVVVSSEYPTYRVRANVASPQYIQLLFRTKFFLRAINSMISGASGRKRVQPSQVEMVKIPLPPLSVQQAIVDYWVISQNEIKECQRNIEKLKKENEKILLRELNIRILPLSPRKGAFVLPWKNLERWDTFFYRFDFVDLDKQLCKIKAAPLGRICNFVSRNWNVSDFPEGSFKYIEISSVNKDEGIVGSKIINAKNAPSRATTLVKMGDLILATTRPYLGAFSIVNQEYDGCVCSSGFALADGLKVSGVDKEFLLHFLKSPAGLLQMERRMTGGLYPAIVQSELEKVMVPLPSIEIQRKIVKQLNDNTKHIEKEQARIIQTAAIAKNEIEEMILGIRPVA